MADKKKQELTDSAKTEIEAPVKPMECLERAQYFLESNECAQKLTKERRALLGLPE